MEIQTISILCHRPFPAVSKPINYPKVAQKYVLDFSYISDLTVESLLRELVVAVSGEF